MAKHVKFRVGKPKARLDAFQLMANPLTANFLSEERYIDAAASFVDGYYKEDFSRRFLELYEKKRFRELFNCSYNSIEDFYKEGTFRITRKKRILEVYGCLLTAHAAEINQFVKARKFFESAVLEGRLDEALVILEDIEHHVGESIWYIRNKILVLSLKGNLQEMQDFAESCTERSTEQFFSYLISCCLLIASDPLLHHKKRILNGVKELDEAGVNQWSDMLRLIFVPRPFFDSVELLSCLAVIQAFNAIDQYCLLTKLSAEVMAFDEGSDATQSEFKDFIDVLQASIEDESLPSLARLEQAQVDGDSLSLKLTSLYETEQYEDLIRVFVSRFNDIEEPLAFVNLVAKAAAIIKPKYLSEMPGLIYQLVESLSSIYMLSVPPNQVEDKISAVVILLYHFSGSSQLQLSLYKSMPLRYNKSEWVRLAKSALLTTTDSTPLSKLLATDMDPLSSHKYITNKSLLPLHRVLRASLQESVGNGDLELLALQAHFDKVPLAKDFYESVSTYYTRAEQPFELIELCARTLAKNPNAYIAFPMRKIVDFIEEEAVCSLDSVIIVYYYVKKIDSTKDYLLNETYEEFFGVNGTSRPSELLEVLDVRDDRALVLFRDVSSFETMDFLGSFSDSNDLRAERVRIIDYLRDAEVIDPEQHRAEVDEIVVQVVVDAGATEFNVAKIHVNDNALKRLISEDLSSLLSLFKSIKFEKEEKIIRLGADSPDGQATKAVVAGDRNTTLLKMLQLIQNSFLYDEKHGLDKNLSAEIRHGFFSNLMRSKLEEANLLTEVDELGNYKANAYWLNANSLVASEILEDIDKQLKWFSASFNELIAEAEEWMNVSSFDVETNRVFHYRTNANDFQIFLTLADVSTTSDEFFDYCITTLWDTTESCMEEMREKLNVDFKNKVDRLFDELISRITDAKSGVALHGLMTSITQTKSDIREDITTVSEWFKRNTEYASTERSIKDLINISIECFERVRGFRLIVEKEVSCLSPVLIDGQHVKAFIVAFVNILENACRHSGFSQSTEIKIESELKGNSWHVAVSNNLSSAKCSSLTSERISQVVDKMKGPLSLNMMRREGGSGLSKAFNQLRTIDGKFDVDVAKIDSSFRTLITYG